jgi:hypothetical protein
MNHHHRTVLHALFAHPVSANIDAAQAKTVPEALGGSVRHGGHGQIIVKLNGHTPGFADTRHSLGQQDVGDARRFLTAAGIDPACDFPL